MNQLKVSTRLSLLVGGMALLLAGVGGLGVYEIREANASLKTVYEDRTVALAQLGEVRDGMQRNQNDIAMAALDPTPANLQRQAAAIDHRAAEITKQWDAYMATFLTPEEKVLAQAFVQARGVFLEQAIRPALVP